MSHNTLALPSATRRETMGLWYGLIGVIIFSFTLPFTRLAVAELNPVFVALARAVIAAICAALWLCANFANSTMRLPDAAQLRQLAVVALGVVVGFPLMSSLAMRDVPAAHGAIVNGILPLSTAIFAMMFASERPSPGFWACAALGRALVIVFALRSGGGSFHHGDWAMLGAVALGGIGYAAGGRLAQTMGGPTVICWALVLSLPILLPVVAWLAWRDVEMLASASAHAWYGLAYLSVFSMFIGFFFWYKGLADGGVARVGQVQLLQPFLTLLAAVPVLGEPLRVDTLGFAVAVIATVALGRRFAVKRK